MYSSSQLTSKYLLSGRASTRFKPLALTSFTPHLSTRAGGGGHREGGGCEQGRLQRYLLQRVVPRRNRWTLPQIQPSPPEDSVEHTTCKEIGTIYEEKISSQEHSVEKAPKQGFPASFPSVGPPHQVATDFASSSPSSSSNVINAIYTAVIGTGLVFFGGVAYLAWYKKNVLDKIGMAFEAGYDPALELANHGKHRNPTVLQELDGHMDGLWTHYLRRKEQDSIDAIIHGAETGHYFMLLGSKGTGKTAMILDAMQQCQAEGVVICDAHPDLEVFRLRLGKALNYEYNEDSQLALFQRRDPREGGPALDIERAMNKLEKVALRYSRRTGKLLVLVINNAHLFKNNEDGRNILLQLQQRAEAWSASGILTFLFSSDDFWPYIAMHKNASRMHVISVYDLNRSEASNALKRMRMEAQRSPEEDETLEKVINILGGRLSSLRKAARSKNMIDTAEYIMQLEKAWVLNQICIIQDCAEDAIDQQKWSSCSWLLLREFVKIRQDDERNVRAGIATGTHTQEDLVNLPLPKIPYYQCCQIMTRPDFLEALDRENIIAIDTNHDVSPDSFLIFRVAREVVEEQGFDEVLEAVLSRVGEIEKSRKFKEVKDGDRERSSADNSRTHLI